MLFLYLRVFPAFQVRRALWAGVSLTVVFIIAFAIPAVFACYPIKHFWLKWDGEHDGSCINVHALGWANAAVSVGLDLTIIAIPLSQVNSLQLTFTKKIWLSLAFLIGTL